MNRPALTLLLLFAAALLATGLFMADRAETMGAQGPGPGVEAGTADNRSGEEARDGAPDPAERTKPASPDAVAVADAPQGTDGGQAANGPDTPKQLPDGGGQGEKAPARDAAEISEDVPVPDQEQLLAATETDPDPVAETRTTTGRDAGDAGEPAPAPQRTAQADAKPWRAQGTTRTETPGPSGQDAQAGAAAARPQGQEQAKGQTIRLFQTAAFRGNFNALPKWKRVLSKAESEVRVLGSCGGGSGCPPGATSWQRIMAQARDLPPMEKLKTVNSFFNKWPYRLDLDAYGTSDWWATPQEFLKISGDCEDFAITKYFALRELGVSPDDMRIVVLKDRIRGIAHAILVVFLQGDALVLDNVTSVVFSHDKYKHYAPYYSLNEKYRWSHIPLDKQP